MNTSVLDTPVREVGYQGGTLKVTPLKIGQLPAFSRAIAPIFSALANVFTSNPLGGGVGGSGEPLQTEAQLLVDAEELLQLMGDHGDRMIEAAAICVGEERGAIEAGNPLEFFELVTAVIEVNADFFAQAMAKMNKAKAAGLKPSSS